VFDLVAYGVGSTVGVGVFVITGVAAKETAGPALVFSFVAAAVACFFSGLCYCEFATRIPVSGSAYTYAYATMGEVRAALCVGRSILQR
jgi:APA family basic amino acid/polyamine antiporter